MQAPDQLLLQSVTRFFESPLGMAVLAAVLLVIVLASCRVFAKAGFRPEVGLLLLVPGLNVVVFAALAFLPWPVLREARQLKKMQKAVHKADVRIQKTSSAA